QTDPAIERWALMRENLYQNFRFTPIKTRQTIVLMIGFPLLGGLLAWSTDARYDWAGKTKGTSLLRSPPAPQSPGEE
ncbi:hypothetical protein BS47DRAFT_1294607, partial [Hydnum rufescens UP504]